jgi:hypothetical protein
MSHDAAIASRPRNAPACGGIAKVASSASRPHDRVDVSPLEGVDEALHDPADTIVSEFAQRGLLAPLGEAFVDGLVGALQGAVDTG